jgi:hypothetical protein
VQSGAGRHGQAAHRQSPRRRVARPPLTSFSPYSGITRRHPARPASRKRKPTQLPGTCRAGGGGTEAWPRSSRSRSVGHSSDPQVDSGAARFVDELGLKDGRTREHGHPKGLAGRLSFHCLAPAFSSSSCSSSDTSRIRKAKRGKSVHGVMDTGAAVFLR